MAADQKDELLVKAIKVFQIEADYSSEDMAKSLGMHVNTFRRKLRLPGTFTYTELKNVFKLMKMPNDQKSPLI